MRIAYVSDIHQEFHRPDQLEDLIDKLPPADVLVIAGDLSEADNYAEDKMIEFFDAISTKYSRTILVLGNHEFYRAEYNSVKKRIPAYIESKWDNISVLEKEFIEIDGVVFLGTTLWTSIRDMDPLTMTIAKRTMNDYLMVKFNTRKFDPLDSVAEFYESKKWLEYELPQWKDKKVVIVTHHAPSDRSIAPEYWESYSELNYCYFSPLETLIMDNPHIHAWIHGHVHSVLEYRIDDTWVLCNSVGYDYDANRDFSGAYFEI